APQVDRSHAQQVYRRVRSWVNTGSVPEASGPAIRATNVAGVRVTLRWLGLTVGAGDLTLPPEQDDPADVVDLAEVAHVATQRAMKDLRQTLGDARRRAAVTGPEAEAEGVTPETLGPNLQLDLQVAHHLTPITLDADAPAATLFFTFAPGYHGLRLRSPDREADAWFWPASAIARNIQPESQMVQLLDAMGYPAQVLEAIARPEGPMLYRFQVIHLVRPQRQAPLMQLTRGNVIIPGSAMDAATVTSIADRITDFILRRQRDAGDFAGTYHPTPDRYDPATADPGATALTILALARRADFLLATGGDEDERTLIAEAALRATRLLTSETDDLSSLPAATRGLLLLAATDTRALANQVALRNQLATSLGLGDQADPDARPAEHGAFAQAVIARAAVALTRTARPPITTEQAAARVNQAWNAAREADAKTRLGALPFLAGALKHLDLPDDHETRARARETLTGWLDRIHGRQVTRVPEIGPDDILGGYALADPPATLTAAAVHPNWYSAPLLMLTAGQLDRQSPDPRQLIRCSLGARFIGQLMFTGPSMFYIRSTDDARGGIRRSLWDNRLAPAPAAWALLALTEFQHATTPVDAGDDD
ncbi:MAG: hypothetical protein R3336_05615, partial [Phycisphaeraceae bacterium]|nr:hypothetical protein [Phycisphaeraceae bacterium]